MSSDPFDLLGLDRATASDADVRRAYAERLKRTRPEDDRAGFMALREAFERARRAVRWRDEYGGDDPYKDYDEDEEDGEAEPEAERAVEIDVRSEPEDEPEDFEEPVGRAMMALIDALTGAPFGPSTARVMAIVEADDVAGIEDYQTLQWQVRQLLCDRTGYHLQPQELRVPDWLRLDVFDALDGYFGWTRQPVTEAWVRSLNDWLVRVRKVIVLQSLPLKERERLDREAQRSLRAGDLLGPQGEAADSQGKGGTFWLVLAVVILVSQVVRALTAG
ncbi:MAG: hypothetical protein RLO80_12230 [Hyphomonas sp.]